MVTDLELLGRVCDVVHSVAIVSSRVARIVADTFERDSGVVEWLAARGVRVDIARLRAGDYDVGSGVLVERKTVVDLHLSLQRGRFWRQLGDLRASARFPCLLVEGPSLDDRTTTPDAIRGACLAVIRSESAADSARWLRLLAARPSPPRDRPVYAQRVKRPREHAGEAMLAAVPGISVVIARAFARALRVGERRAGRRPGRVDRGSGSRPCASRGAS